jgi:hypothetical protein
MRHPERVPPGREEFENRTYGDAVLDQIARHAVDNDYRNRLLDL